MMPALAKFRKNLAISLALLLCCLSAPAAHAQAQPAVDPAWGVLAQIVDHDYLKNGDDEVTVRWEVYNERMVVTDWRLYGRVVQRFTLNRQAGKIEVETKTFASGDTDQLTVEGEDSLIVVGGNGKTHPGVDRDPDGSFTIAAYITHIMEKYLPIPPGHPAAGKIARLVQRGKVTPARPAIVAGGPSAPIEVASPAAPVRPPEVAVRPPAPVTAPPATPTPTPPVRPPEVAVRPTVPVTVPPSTATPTPPVRPPEVAVRPTVPVIVPPSTATPTPPVRPPEVAVRPPAPVAAPPAVATPAPPVAPAIAAAPLPPRVALVIGNTHYGPEIGSLANPGNDAQLIAEGLRSVGFNVELVLDADQRKMKQAIARLGDRVAAAGKGATGLFYYAGHGMQSRDINYLIPLGAAIAREADVDLEAVPADVALSRMVEAGASTSIVILDACRNTPVIRTLRDGTRGLARMETPNGSFFSYSTAPGSVARDGAGGNSPFALALSEEMQRSGQQIEVTFRNVRRSVLAATNGLQTPWDSSSLIDSFVFKQ